MWTDLTDNRDPGSLERQPVVDKGKDVRWGEQIADGINLTHPGDEWDAPRVVYVQHASDGVLWWSPSLLWAKPDRLSESRGPDVLGSVDWYPVVTFFQTTLDLSWPAGPISRRARPPVPPGICRRPRRVVGAAGVVRRRHGPAQGRGQ